MKKAIKTIYAYNKKTGEYIGGFSEENPTIPTDCGLTEKAPMSAGHIFENSQWILPTEIQLIDKKAQLISARIEYLKSTDWYLTREQDEPNSYPSEIKAKRILAREEINEIETCKTIKQLNKYSIEF